MQNLSGEALNSAGQDEPAAGTRPNQAPSQRTDLPRLVSGRAYGWQMCCADAEDCPVHNAPRSQRRQRGSGVRVDGPGHCGCPDHGR
jgi:hypothetical protein